MLKAGKPDGVGGQAEWEEKAAVWELISEGKLLIVELMMLFCEID